MEQIQEFLKLTGIDPALLSTAIPLAILLRYMRGMLHWADSALTFYAAMALAVIGAVLKMAAHDPWRATVLNGLLLLVLVLVVQYGLERWADKAWFIPRDNEWVKPGGAK